MKGHLTIAKNNAFYNINNNLIKVNILGRNNKVVNPFRINDLYIHSDYNTIEVINGGKINILSYLIPISNIVILVKIIK